MSDMFGECRNLTYLDLSGFNTENVKDMSGMFNSCTQLTELNISKFDTENVTDMHEMFSYCGALEALNITSFNTKKVTDMHDMFNNCEALTELDLSSFNTEEVTNMKYMFNQCKSLKALDLNSFSINNVENMTSMFGICSALKTITCSKDWSTSDAFSNMMFLGCTALVGSKGTVYDDAVTDKTYARPDGGTGKPGYFTGSVNIAEKEIYTVFDEETGTLTYYYDDQMASRTGVIEVYDPFFYDNGDNRFLVYSEKVLRAVIDPSMKNAPLTSMKAMFYGRGGNYLKPSRYLTNMTAIEGLENLNTSNVTDMSFMFNGCKSLTSLDLSSFNTAKVTDMSGMFADCSSLTSLDLNPLNTSNVTDMSFMFNGCSALTSLDLSPLNTSNVTDMRGMFYFCDDLPSLDLSSFNTDKVTSMRNMFCSCEKLTTIICDDDWSTSSVLEDSEDMFDGCTALVGGKGTTYDSNFTDATYARPDGGTGKPGYFTASGNIAENKVYTEFDEETGTLTYYYDDQMASRSGVTELYDPVNNPEAVRFTDYYRRVTKAVIDKSMAMAPLTSTRDMFFGGTNPETWVMQSLSKMESIEGLENLNTENVTDMCNMFSLCQSLKMLDLNTFNTSNVTKMVAMFQLCEKLEIVDVSSFDISKVTDLGQMFNYCPSLTTICCATDWSGTTAKSDFMFSNCTSLVGGNGTVFDKNFSDASYARPDGGTSSPGYFTAETMTGLEAIHNSQSIIHNEEGAAIYNLAGQKMVNGKWSNGKLPRGIYIVGGRKVVVK